MAWGRIKIKNGKVEKSMRKKIVISIIIVLMLASMTPITSSINIGVNKEQIKNKSYDEDFKIEYDQNGDEIEIRLEIFDYLREEKIIDDESYFSIKIGDESQILKKGYPDLPNICRSFIIPNDKKMGVRIIDSNYITVENIDISPSKGNILRKNNPSDIPFEFADIYNEDTWYPKDIVDLREPYILREYRGQTVCFQPFQYNPVRKTLRIYTMIKIDLIPIGSAEINVLKNNFDDRYNSNSYNRIYNNHFFNFDDFSYTPVSEEGNMLVICYDDFYEEMQSFVNWKNMKGIPTEIVNVSDAGGTSTGIKNYIVNYYNSYGLTFILLVGDIAQVPTINAGGSASDPSYGYISGSDSYPEVFVGRFSAQNLNQLDTIVNRSINYEKNPDVNSDWYHKGLGIGSNEGGPGTGKGDDNEADWQHMRNIRTDLMGFTYTIVDELYDGSHGGEDEDGSPNENDVSVSVNDGRSIINYCGHGSAYGWSTTGFGNSDVEDLVNANMLPFIISVACNNGQFDDYSECFCEAWQRATYNGEPTGAIVITGSSMGMAWDPPMDAQDEMNDLLTEQYTDNIMHTVGGIHVNGCMHMNDEYGSSGYSETDAWHIFGDPSLMHWTDTPVDMTVTHPSIVNSGSTSYELNVLDTGGALCAMSNNGVLLGFSYTDENGDCIINFDEPLSDFETVNLVVTSFNKNPYIITLDVLPPVRQPSEFEPMEGVLIRYPFGISYSLISEMSEDVEVVTIVASESEKNTVENLYETNGVNTDHTSYLIAPSDSIWTRDYGPWYVFNQTNNDMEIIDFDYNRPRPNDDNIPYMFSLNQSLNYTYMDIVHTGGNYMTDGHGTSVSTELVWDENPGMTHDEIDQMMSQYLGIDTYHVRPDVNNEYIRHIDCWAKYLSPDTIMIREVPTSHSQYDEIEQAVDYFETSISYYNQPYNVVRVYTPNDEPYTNSLILNDKVLVPITGGQWDDEAITSYENAMPGYEVIGFTAKSGYPWESTDALHCRTKGIPDRNMLYIDHIPSSYKLPSDDGFYIEANVKAYSDTDISIGFPKVFWCNSTSIWNSFTMSYVEDDIYGGYIPNHPCGETIEYYIQAIDETGRSENNPYIGQYDPHSFIVTLIPDIWVSPELFNFIDSADKILYDSFLIGNDEYAGEQLNYSISCTDYDGHSWLSVDITYGELLPDNYNEIQVLVDTSELTVGNYYEEIIINSNDPDEPIIIIPVYLTIVYADDVGTSSINSPQGTISHGQYSINATLENYGSKTQNGLIANCTIMEGIFGTFLYEDFTADFPPEGWTQEEEGEWTKYFGNNAGGTSPEARLYWNDINADYACLDSKPVNTIGASSLKLGFNHSIDHYSNSFNCRVFSRADSYDSWTDVTPWENPVTNDMGPLEEKIDITNDIGSNTQLRFEFQGNDYYLNNWYLDDVHIYAPMDRGPGDIIYTTENIVDIDPLSSKYIEFTPEWDVDINGFYAIKVSTKLSGDQDLSNDICIDTVEIFEDINPPDISNINDYPDPQIMDKYVNITVTAADETEVDTVRVDITGPAGFIGVNESMIHGEQDNFYYNQNYSIVGNYSYYIWAADTLGHSVKSSIFTFTIVDDSYLSLEIPMHPGWNLMTVPIQNGWYASHLAYNISSSNSISRWDPALQTYDTYIVGGPPSFDFEIQDGYGYFIDVDESSILTMIGLDITDVEVSLKTGWNLIGWYKESSTTASSIAENITGCTSISCWDPALQTYDTYIVGGPPSFDFEVTCGMGMFVDVSTDSIWHGEG